MAAARLVLLVAVLAVSYTTGAATSASEPGPLERAVEERVAAARAPGVAAAVVGPEGVRALATHGEDGDGAPVSSRTPFLWGSVSKPVAATVAVHLAATGRLDLEEPVVRRLPAFRVSPADQATRITARQLLDHTSGLPAAMETTDVDDPARTSTGALDDLASQSLVGPPGSGHRYSSANYLVLAALIEEITGRSYAAELTATVLEPLGMTGAVTGPDQYLPPGHRFVAGLPVALRPPFDPAGLAYGYLGGTVEDLATFARAQLSDGPRVLDDGARAALHAPGPPTGGGGSYGLGWRHGTLEGAGERTLWHAGAAPGYQSAIVVLPDRERAVVVLQNAYGPFQDDALLSTAMDVAALAAGTSPSPRTATPWYPVTLTVLATVVLGLFAAALGLGRELAGARSRPRRPVQRAVGRLVAATVVAVALGVLLPSALGVPLDRLGLWVPDLALGAWTALVLAGVLGAGAVVAALRSR